MKRFLLAITLILSLSLETVVFADTNNIIGTALNTDIVAYINNYAIPSYAVNGQSAIVAEELRNFGFDVNWDEGTRTLLISRNNTTYVTEMQFTKQGASGTKFSDLLSTDISVYANNTKLTSYAINGYTMIPIEELSIFGTCIWVEEERAVKLWIDNLTIRDTMQAIESDTSNDIIAEQSTSSPSLTYFSSPYGYFEKNSVDGIDVKWGALNTSGKVINYYTVHFTFFNAVGDFAYDEITHRYTKSVYVVGPVNPGSQILISDIIGYVPVCHTVRVDSIDIIYADGSTESVWCGQSIDRVSSNDYATKLQVLLKLAIDSDQ